MAIVTLVPRAKSFCLVVSMHIPKQVVCVSWVSIIELGGDKRRDLFSLGARMGLPASIFSKLFLLNLTSFSILPVDIKQVSNQVYSTIDMLLAQLT